MVDGYADTDQIKMILGPEKWHINLSRNKFTCD
jgi:hypothetical protein